MAVTSQRGTPVTGPTTVPQPLPIRNGGEPKLVCFRLNFKTFKSEEQTSSRRGCGNGGKPLQECDTKETEEEAAGRKKSG
jgi:hypothetical protein